MARAPPKPSPNWTRGLGRGPSLPSFPSSPLSPSSPSWTRKGGNLLQLGVGIILPGAPLLGPASSPLLLYIRGQGAPHRHKLIHVIIFLAVCGAPFHHSPR